jgi:DsbC/DsbD-like thiol-disulfide interchange protein
MNSVARAKFVHRSVTMTMVSVRLPALLAACALGLLIGTSAATAAEDASRWDGDARSSARLIAGSQPTGGGPVRAGIELKLKPGWHTYWRYPGDAGMPPSFDFAASSNVKAIEVMWPAPRRIPEQGMVAIGYTSDVILPLHITPKDRSKPVTLRLKLGYAVCEKLCVPAEAKAELTLAGGTSSQDARLAEAEARVPRKVALGEGSDVVIRSLRRDDGATPARVIVDLAAPSAADLFAEGPTPDWALPLPAVVPGAPAGLQRFTFALDGAPPGAKYQGARLTLTAVAGQAAIEVAIRLD